MRVSLHRVSRAVMVCAVICAISVLWPVSAQFGNTLVDLLKLNGTTVDTNSGTKSAGTQRIVLATDQPQLTNKLLVTPDANSAVNVAQLNGTTTDTNSGNKSAGTLRTVLATDQPQLTNPLWTGWKRTYTASAAVTCTLASLATSSTLVAGEECAAIDNSSALAGDYLISGKFTTGTSPAAGQIEVWIIPELEDSSYPDVFDGTDSTETATSRDILTATGMLAWVTVTDTTNNRTYYMRKTSVAGLFAGSVPRKFVIFVTHSTGVNLNSTGSNQAVYQQAVQ